MRRRGDRLCSFVAEAVVTEVEYLQLGQAGVTHKDLDVFRIEPGFAQSEGCESAHRWEFEQPRDPLAR